MTSLVIFNKLIVDFLYRGIEVPIAREYLVCLFRLCKKAAAEPFNFGFFGQFRKTGDRLRVVFHTMGSKIIY
ncbi:MAG: hypothetical protein EBZ62_03455 [Sphingobacteriia bacterium]|nr:hypothetical protein [Sphingobacteriia bacterium]